MVRKNQLGFTLIEVMVAMSIVAILTAISLSSISGVRKSSRDGKRKADLEQIRSALEIYRSDCLSYPSTLPAAGQALTATCNGSTNTYLSSMPDDPMPGIYKYSYSRSATSTNIYSLCAHLELGGTSELCAAASCGASGVCNYKQSNP